jgi:hypothetical protein
LVLVRVPVAKLQQLPNVLDELRVRTADEQEEPEDELDSLIDELDQLDL